MESSFENLEVMHSRSGALEREKKDTVFSVISVYSVVKMVW